MKRDLLTAGIFLAIFIGLGGIAGSEDYDPLKPVLIKAEDIRVEYARGLILESHLDSPLALQQGFTFNRSSSDWSEVPKWDLAQTRAGNLSPAGDITQQPGGSMPLTYMGPWGRISIGIDEEGVVGDFLGILGKENHNAWIGQLWLGEAGAGGLQLDYHWLHGTPEEPGSVLKVFAAIDQNKWDDRKVGAGFGWEKKDSFIDAYLMHSITGARRVATVGNIRFYEHPYDYGGGVRVGRFFEPWLLRGRAGLDYERGRYDSNQWTLSAMLDKYIGKTGLSISLQGEYLRKHGDFETDKSDVRGVALLRYEFGSFRPLAAGEGEADSKQEPPAIPAWIERALRNPSEHKRTVDVYKFEERTATVSAANQAPIAVDDSISYIGSSGSVLIDVLANDSDPDGDTLTIISVTPPSLLTASVTIEGNAVRYNYPLGTPGSDQFTYTISDGRGGTATANVNVTITI
jgi:hypothetical protein